MADSNEDLIRKVMHTVGHGMADLSPEEHSMVLLDSIWCLIQLAGNPEIDKFIKKFNQPFTYEFIHKLRTEIENRESD